MADKFNLAEWLTAAGAITAAYYAGRGIMMQWEYAEPLFEPSVCREKNGLVEFKVYVIKRDEAALIVHAARIKDPRHGRIGLDTPYHGIQNGLRFDLPFKTNEIPLNIEIRDRVSPMGGTYGRQFSVFVELDSSKASKYLSIDFLVSIKARPRRKRWVTVTSVVPAIITPQIPITSA
jgi:hypothetical protein